MFKCKALAQNNEKALGLLDSLFFFNGKQSERATREQLKH